MPEEKAPGVHIEEQKSKLRLEETDAETAACDACRLERERSGDATAYCPHHLRKIYGV